MQILVILCIFLKSWSFAESNKVFRNNKLNDYAKVSQLNLKNDIIQADIAVGNVIQALEKIAFYYLKHKKEMTVDFAFGLRAAEGELYRVLHMAEIGAYPLVTSDSKIQKTLKKLLQTIQMNIKKSLPFIEKNDKKYFDMFYPLLKQKWSSYQFVPQFVFRDITAFSNITQDEMQEERSDICMAHLMGTGDVTKCHIETCWNEMTAANKARYYNTHQILWLLLGDRMGCRETMDKRAKADGYANGIDDLLNKKCATAIIEMEAIVQDGVRRGLIDLFLEQGFICGGMGFMDAVRPGWLKLAFQWQDPTIGCFSETTLTEDEKREFKFWIEFKREEWRSRNILVDTIIEDGCSTHTSGVGAAFFAAYLRLFFDPIYKKTQLDPYLAPDPAIAQAPKKSPGSYVKVVFLIIFLLVLLILGYKKRFIRQIYKVFFRKVFRRTRRKFSRSPLLK